MAEGLLSAVLSKAEAGGADPTSYFNLPPFRDMSNPLIQGDSDTISCQAQRDLFLFCKGLVPDFKTNERQLRSVAPIKAKGTLSWSFSSKATSPIQPCGTAGSSSPERQHRVEEQDALSCPTLSLKCCVTLGKSLAPSVSHVLRLHDQLFSATI